MVSRSVSNDRLAVAASVTNSPVNWCTSQVSLVVTTPARVALRAQPLHLRRREVAVQHQAGALFHPVFGIGLAAAQSFCATVLPYQGGLERAPLSRIPGQNRFALIGQ